MKELVGDRFPKLSHMTHYDLAMTLDNVDIRAATGADIEEIINVCSSALGWADPEFDEALFRWKHLDNAFGYSALLVAVEAGEILAVRPFMRWRFASETETLSAARAVDTATRPDAQGRGLFRALTEAGVSQLRSEDVGFIFNTPNAKSLPGYLKMGWEQAGSVPLGYKMRSPQAAGRMLKSRTAANKPSIPTPELGQSVAEGIAGLEPGLLVSRDEFLRTDHTLETLLWRYSSGPIEYRFVPGPHTTGAVVRLRQRGPSRELVVAELLGTPSIDDARTIVRDTLAETDADYCICTAGVRRTISIERLGPKLAIREITRAPKPDSLHWQPGDIELF